MRHQISLSTIPPRFADIGWTLQSLVRQTSRPEAVKLYIPRSYRRFPQWGGALPEVPDGVTIVRVEEDLGPATKILPAARAYRGQDIELLYCDDDHLYAPDWAARFLRLRRRHPGVALCAVGPTLPFIGLPAVPDAHLPRAIRAPWSQNQFGYQLGRLLAAIRKRDAGKPRLRPRSRKTSRSGYTDIAEGYAGVAVRPEFLDDDAAFNIPRVLWTVDDVWLSGHLARRGIPIWADLTLNRSQMILDTHAKQPLSKSVIDGSDRRAANLACATYMRDTYGIWGGAATSSV